MISWPTTHTNTHTHTHTHTHTRIHGVDTFANIIKIADMQVVCELEISRYFMPKKHTKKIANNHSSFELY